MPKVLIAGESHAVGMARQYGAFADNWNAAKNDFGAIPALRSEPFGYLLITHAAKNFFQISRSNEQLWMQVSQEFLQPLKQVAVESTCAYCLLGGNEHNSLFFQSHPRPFDFFHPAFPNNLLPNRQLVPMAVVREAIERALSLTSVQLQLLHTVLGNLPLVFVAPPPPNPSEAYIHSQAENFDFSLAPVEDAMVRLKVYSVYVDALRDICQRQGIVLLEAPPDRRDAIGFLAREYWENATHATPAYYDGMISTT